MILSERASLGLSIASTGINVGFAVESFNKNRPEQGSVQLVFALIALGLGYFIKKSSERADKELEELPDQTAQIDPALYNRRPLYFGSSEVIFEVTPLKNSKLVSRLI